MRKILLLLVGLNLLLASAASSAEITKDSNGDVLSKFDYDRLDEKAKDEFIAEYASKIQDNANNQLNENFANIVKQLEKNGDFEKAKAAQEIYDSYELSLNIEDVKLKLEQSLLEPVEFETSIKMNTNSSLDGYTTSLGGYVTVTENKYIWFSGRSITNSIYLEAWTTPIVFDGTDGDTYDISELIYSWSGSSTYKDRVQSIECSVVQYDPRIPNSDEVTYNTGWPEHYYSGSFYKTSTSLNLSAGCVIAGMGCVGTGIEVNALFDDGDVTKTTILSEGWGSLPW